MNQDTIKERLSAVDALIDTPDKWITACRCADAQGAIVVRVLGLHAQVIGR